MSLTRIELDIAYEVFAKHSKNDFAYGYYDREVPMISTTTTASASSSAYTYIVPMRTAQCKAEVAGLDQSAFLAAVEEYLERSRTELYNILAKDKE